MASPIATIVSVNVTKISHKSSKNQCTVVFSFDQPIQAYTVNILGTSPTSGTIAGAKSNYVSDIKSITVSTLATKTVQSTRQIEAGTQITEVIDDLEVGSTATDGSYQVNIYGKGLDLDVAFVEDWDSISYSRNNTTINSVGDSNLNVTSTSNDPMIMMYNIGSFDPSIYRFLEIRYRVTVGTAGNVEIFFTNTQYTVATGGISRSTPLVSDGTWQVVTLDMSKHANWDDSNITGWRFDWCTASGVTMDIDYIRLLRSDGTWTPYNQS